MKHLFIVNPVAGGHDSTELVSARVAQAFSGREEDFEIYTTRAPMRCASMPAAGTARSTSASAARSGRRTSQ